MEYTLTYSEGHPTQEETSAYIYVTPPLEPGMAHTIAARMEWSWDRRDEIDYGNSYVGDAVGYEDRPGETFFCVDINPYSTWNTARIAVLIATLIDPLSTGTFTLAEKYSNKEPRILPYGFCLDTIIE